MEKMLDNKECQKEGKEGKGQNEIEAVVDSTEKKCVVEEQYFRVITRKYNASIFLLQVSPLFAIIYSW